MNIDELEYVKSGGPSNEELDKLDGTKVPIAKCEVVDDTSGWKDNQKLPEGQEIQVKRLLIETVPFGNDLIGRDITHREKYNLKEKDGQWVVSLHEKSKTGQFLAKYGLNGFTEAVGINVLLVKKTNPETKRSYLQISI